MPVSINCRAGLAWATLLAWLLVGGGPLRAQSIVNLVTTFKAVGNGIADDHAAFSRAEAYLNAHPTGVRLVIPRGTYLVGRQGAAGTPGVDGYYHGDDVLALRNCRNVRIEGQAGAVIKFRVGLRFGHFADGLWTPGYAIHLIGCAGVTVSNLTIDGNSDACNFGHTAAEVQANTQLEAAYDGVYVDNTRDVTLTGLRVRHMGRDGLMLKFADGTYPKGAAPVELVLRDCTFEYNGRDGFSWVSGAGVRATNCRFNHQGQGRIRSGLKAGIDIEPEGGNYLWDGTFTNCEFINNLQTGVLGDAGPTSAPDQARAIHFSGCTISGNDQPGKGSGPAIIAKWPSLTFDACKIYGQLLNAYNAPDDQTALQFTGCAFTDAPLNGQATTLITLVQLYHSGARMRLTECDFTIHSYAISFTQIDNLGDPPSQNIRVRSCRFHTAYSQPLVPALQMVRSKATNLTFEGNCQFLAVAGSAPRSRRKVGLGAAARHVETPIYSFWPVQVAGTLTLAGGPDIRYLIDSQQLTVLPGGKLVIADRNEVVVYTGANLRVEPGAALVVQAGGELTTIGGGTVQVEGTLLVQRGGFLCGDYGQPILVGARGKLQYEAGATPGTDPLRYPDNERNCQGTPPVPQP